MTFKKQLHAIDVALVNKYCNEMGKINANEIEANEIESFIHRAYSNHGIATRSALQGVIDDAMQIVRQ